MATSPRQLGREGLAPRPLPGSRRNSLPTGVEYDQPLYAVGSTVEICNLRSAAQFNGEIAQVTHFDPETRRYDILVARDSSTRLVNERNLRWARQPESDDGQAVVQGEAVDPVLRRHGTRAGSTEVSPRLHSRVGGPPPPPPPKMSRRSEDGDDEVPQGLAPEPEPLPARLPGFAAGAGPPPPPPPKYSASNSIVGGGASTPPASLAQALALELAKAEHGQRSAWPPPGFLGGAARPCTAIPDPGAGAIAEEDQGPRVMLDSKARGGFPAPVPGDLPSSRRGDVEVAQQAVLQQSQDARDPAVAAAAAAAAVAAAAAAGTAVSVVDDAALTSPFPIVSGAGDAAALRLQAAELRELSAQVAREQAACFAARAAEQAVERRVASSEEETLRSVTNEAIAAAAHRSEADKLRVLLSNEESQLRNIFAEMEDFQISKAEASHEVSIAERELRVKNTEETKLAHAALAKLDELSNQEKHEQSELAAARRAFGFSEATMKQLEYALRAKEEVIEDAAASEASCVSSHVHDLERTRERAGSEHARLEAVEIELQTVEEAAELELQGLTKKEMAALQATVNLEKAATKEATSETLLAQSRAAEISKLSLEFAQERENSTALNFELAMSEEVRQREVFAAGAAVEASSRAISAQSETSEALVEEVEELSAHLHGEELELKCIRRTSMAYTSAEFVLGAIG